MICLVPFGRGGVYFLQSLFDNHPEVLMYPGNFDFYNRVVLSRTDWQDHWRESLRGTFAYIPLATHMNINQGLGADGSGALNLDVDELMRLTKECLTTDRPDSRTLFLAAHYAVARFMKKDLSAVRCILLHDHHHPMSGETERAISRDFPESIFVYTVKDPRANYYSQRRAKKYLMSQDGFDHLKFHHYMTITCVSLYQWGLNLLNGFPGRAWIVRLEDIQEQKEKFIRSLCRELGVTFRPSLLQTTFGGMEWRGDAASLAPKSGFRKTADPKLWQDGLHPLRVAALDILLREEIRALGYHPVYGPRHAVYWLALLLLPFWKYEDYDVLFDRRYYEFKRQAVWRVVLQDVKQYLRSVVGLVKRLLSRPAHYPNVPAVIFKA